MKANKTIIGGGALFGLAFLSVSLLSSPFVHADSSGTVDITAILPTNCSMVTTNNNLAVNASVGMNNEIGTAKIKALCNDANGFAIYAVGYTDEQYGNNVLTTELTTDEHNYDIETGLGTSGDSNWNMTITNDGDVENDYVASIESAFATAHEIPDVYTKVASFSASTDQSIGSNILATFNTYIAPAQPASTYHGKVKFTLVHPGVNTPNTIDEPYPMQKVAMWAETVTEGRTVRVYDERDNVEYTAARLADGKIWMTKNLNLNLADANITADNTNNPTQEFLEAANTKPVANNTEWCGRSIAECTDKIAYSTVNLNDDTTDSYGHKYSEYGIYYNWYTATAGNGTLGLGGPDSGSYYNYAVAEGDICPSGWHLPTSDTPNRSESGDFWELASAIVEGNEYPTSATNAVRLLSGTASFLLSGNVRGYSVSDPFNVFGRGDRGAYWTNMKYERSYYARYWYISNNGMHGNNYGDGSIYYGNPVRCLANLQSYTVDVVYGAGVESISIDGNVVPNGGTVTFVEGTSHEITTTLSSGYEFTEWSAMDGVVENRKVATTNFKMGHKPITITSNARTIVGFDDAFSMAGKSKLNGYYRMQDMTPAICESVSKNQEGQVIDLRDNTVYPIAKLADGECWMTKNLRLNIETANITMENTNNPTASFVEDAANNTKNAANNGGWCGWFSADCADRIQYNTANIGNGTTDSLGHTYDEYGVYYNWYTATAGNGTYAISTSGQSVDVSGDICPLGWHLPTLKTNGGELNKLVESIGANVDVFASPANLVLSGMKYYGDSPELSSLGSTGYYWSSTSYNSSNPLANYLAVNYYQSSNPPVIFNPNVYGYYKVMSGYSVRCLAN